MNEYKGNIGTSKESHFGHMKTVHQFIKDRQFFKSTLERDHPRNVRSGPHEVSGNLNGIWTYRVLKVKGKAYKA